MKETDYGFGQQFYLNPFKSRLDTAINWTAQVYQKKPKCASVSWASGKGFLGQVPQTATLLIDGHSSEGLPMIISHDAKGDNIAEQYSATQIAELLSDFGGLPVNHLRIRILACFGGKDSSSGQCFARTLARTLGSKNYKHIAVGGYFWSVNTMVEGGARYRIGNDEISREDLENHNKSHTQQQLERILWFDHGGNRIEKPRLYNPDQPNS
jgi:hypothetical protein